MTPEERKRMNEICGQLATEEDPETFDKLLRELNELLEQKHESIHVELKPN